MKLIEGEDYTLEDGRMVLSREFLLKRGYCCNNRCRNCPYSVEKCRRREDTHTYTASEDVKERL